MLSQPNLNTKSQIFIPLLFNSTSTYCRLSPRAAGPAFKPHLQPAFELSVKLSSATPIARGFATSSARLRSRMPPKKKEEEKKVLLGRPGNSLKSGIVRMIRPRTSPPNVLLNFHRLLGRLSKCRKIDSFPSHYKMLVG